MLVYRGFFSEKQEIEPRNERYEGYSWNSKRLGHYCFRNNDFEALMNYLETYASMIRESQKKDYELWKVGVNDLPRYKADMKTYLRKRARYIDGYVNSL